MKIIVSHVYSRDNKGDAALLSVLLADIKRTFADSQITILTIESVESGEKFEKVPIVSSFMSLALNRYNSKLAKLSYSIAIMVTTLTWALGYRILHINMPLPAKLSSICKTYAESDLVIPVGGGYLRGKPGFISFITLLLLLHPLVIASILRKPTILYPQSIGPFGSRLQQNIATLVLKRMKLIIIRENTTKVLLTEMGVTDNVLKSIDSGFAFTTTTSENVRNRFKLEKSDLVVGITVRKWLNSQQQEQYEQAVAKAADYFIDTYNAVIIFVPQVTSVEQRDDDRDASKSVFNKMRNRSRAKVITDTLDHFHIKAMYGDFDYLIGTRFHSVIFALTSHVPCIAIEYEHKTSGIMNDLGLDEWVIKIEDVNASKLQSMIDHLVLVRQSYIKQLGVKLPKYIGLSVNTPVLMHQAYLSSVASDKQRKSSLLRLKKVDR